MPAMRCFTRPMQFATARSDARRAFQKLGRVDPLRSHFFVGNPLNKTPRRVCRLSSHYDCIDLTEIPDDYLPRTNYVPDCDPEEYNRRIPTIMSSTKVRVDRQKKKVTHFYRHRTQGEWSDPASERTLNVAIAPQ